MRYLDEKVKKEIVKEHGSYACKTASDKCEHDVEI